MMHGPTVAVVLNAWTLGGTVTFDATIILLALCTHHGGYPRCLGSWELTYNRTFIVTLWTCLTELSIPRNRRSMSTAQQARRPTSKPTLRNLYPELGNLAEIFPNGTEMTTLAAMHCL